MDEKGGLDSLQNKLYQREGISSRKKEVTSRKHIEGAPSSWQTPPSQKRVKKKSLPFIFFITSLVFFLVAIAVAIAFFVYGGRTISPNNLTIVSDIPGGVASGEATALRFSIRNTNPVALLSVRATVSFPDGTKDGNNITTALARVTKDIGPLAVGEEKDILFSAIFFGEENEIKKIQVSVEYRGEDSSAVIVKEKIEAIRITTAPVSITIDAPQQISSGDSFTTTVSLRSNSPKDISNLFMLAQYPFGFSIEKTVPTATLENTVWNIGTLKKGEVKKITIQGSLQGVGGGENAITFSLGTDINQAGERLGITFAKKQSLFSITDSVLAMSVSLAGTADAVVVANAGQETQGRITYTNTTDTTLFDVAIAISVDGDALDLNRITSQQGFYRSSDKTIVFNRDTNVELRSVEPGAQGTIVFRIPIKSSEQLGTVRNPEVSVVGRVTARQVNAANVPSRIVQTFSRTVQIKTKLILSETIERTVGSFVNTGPWPLKANVPSTFTVRIRAENTTNTLANSEVSIEFPSYVTYTGSRSPQGEQVSYDNTSKKLRWVIDNLPSNSARSISIQISVLPSSSQIGKEIILVQNVIADGFDRFVKQTISATLGQATSKNITDPAYSPQKGIVTQ